ncbi:Tim10/DDP family zinc finger-domain-containing protein [Spinellus fusiger]|nr:Tim10/DDP family zinc finger-domain-containing protein [Spinellus fusiger]
MASWGSFSQTYADPTKLMAAEHQVDAFMDLYNRITETCRKKCIPVSYHEPDLNKGESKCIDRCVGKYVAMQTLLGQKMEQNASSTESGSFVPDALLN